VPRPRSDPEDLTGATPAGGAPARPDPDRVRLTGELPGAEAFEAEYPGADLLSSMLARAIERLAETVSAAIAQVWRAHGLSHAAGNALAVIEGAGQAITPGEISDAMHVTSGSITSLLDTLEKRGLVQRASHAEDRRKVLVDITPEGQALLDAALPSIQLVARRLGAGITDADRRRLFALIEKLHTSIASIDPTELPTGTRHRPDRLSR
jgi:DNA-binding MarR family transcriptional regulator